MKRKILYGTLSFLAIVVAVQFVRIHFFPPRFETLSDFRKLADMCPEDFSCIGECDWADPDFSHMYKDLEWSWVDSLRNIFKLKVPPRWCCKNFKSLLEDVLRKRVDISEPSVNLSFDLGQECFVWGDLQGSFHSFVRCLEELVVRGVLEDDLTIARDIFFVILGDAINRSPYSLETLSLILTLMQKNPDRVIYLRGRHESDGYWENFNLRRSLKIRCASLFDPIEGFIPLGKPLNAFFETLPESLLINHVADDSSVVYFSHGGFDSSSFKSDRSVLVDIMGEQRLLVPIFGKGLNYLGFNRGVVRWSLASCQTYIYRNFFKFYYDTFVMFTMGDAIETSTLSRFTNDIRTKDGFTTTLFDIMFGKKLESKRVVHEKESKKTFLIGSSIPLSGVAAEQGLRVEKGMGSSISNRNDQTRKGDYLVKPIVLDDQYVPWIAQENIEKLIREGVEVLLLPYGSPTIISYLDKIKSGQILALFPFTGSPVLRTPDIKSIVHLRPSFSDEVTCLMRYELDELDVTDFAFFYQDDEFGRPPLEAAHEILRKRGITQWTDIPYSREQINFTAQAKALYKANPGAVGFFSIPRPSRKLIESLGVDFFLGKHLFGIMDLGNEAFKRFIQSSGLTFTFSMVVPDPATSSLDIVADYRRLMDKLGFAYESDSLEAFMATELLLYVISMLKPPYTKEKIMQKFEGFKRFPYKGLMLNFNQKTHDLGQPVWLNTAAGGIIPCIVDDVS